jgi:hypothetical protein
MHNLFEEGIILYDNGTFSRVCEKAEALAVEVKRLLSEG